MRIEGTVIAHLFDADKLCPGFPVTITNLITLVGDQMLQKKFTGQGTVSTTVSGMKLGAGTIAAAKTGTGSYINTTNYVTASALAFDAGFPTVSSATANASEMKVTWNPAVVSGTVADVAIVNNTTNAGEADGTGTFARTIFPAAFLMGVTNKLIITWIWTFIGS